MTMKQAIRCVLTAAVFFAFSGFAGEMAVVNMENLFENYYKKIRQDSALQKQKSVYEDHARSVVEDIKTLEAERDKFQEESLNIGLSDDERARNRREAEARDAAFQEKKKEFRSFMQEKEKEYGRKIMEIRNKLVTELKGHVDEFAADEGYDWVFDVSGNTSNLIPVIVHFPVDADITDVILAEVNKGHEDEVAAALAEKEKGE